MKSAAKSLYVHASDCTLTWTSAKPKQSGATGPYGDLPAAKAAALDALLGTIERAEKLLSIVRHCDSLEALRKASGVKK
jgi:hypothetical protein